MAAIAVVMPVYNRQDRVAQAIDSVLAQDFADFELIVVDDGSSDATVSVVEAYDDPRVVLLRQDSNRGGNAARNAGLRAATAPLVSFLDSDDLFLPTKLGAVTRYFAGRPDIDVLIDSFELIHPERPELAPTPRINPRIEGGTEIQRAVFAREIFKATPAISLRRDVALAIGGFDETLKRRQDFDFVIRLARAARCASIDEVLWTKRWSPDAISAKQDTFVAATIDLCRRHPDYLAEPDNRIGLARDVARHFGRLLSRAEIATAVADARRLKDEFGAGALARLLSDGVREIVRRKRAKALPR